METLLSVLFWVWAACVPLAACLSYGSFQRTFAVIAQGNRFADGFFSVLLSFAGPVSLIVTLCIFNGPRDKVGFAIPFTRTNYPTDDKEYWL